MPEDIKSTGNQLWIKFVSDSSVQKAGFAATFMKGNCFDFNYRGDFTRFLYAEYDECSNAEEHGCEHECFNTLGGYSCQCRIGFELHSDQKRCESKINLISQNIQLEIILDLDACGGLIEALNGTITSPSFPDLYPANKNCIWEILAPPQWRITVNFTHFDIEGNNVSKAEVIETIYCFIHDKCDCSKIASMIAWHCRRKWDLERLESTDCFVAHGCRPSSRPKGTPSGSSSARTIPCKSLASPPFFSQVFL